MIEGVNKEIRRLGIGGSEIAVLFGVHPFLDEFDLYLRKKDLLPEGEPTIPQVIGNFLEGPILEMYSYSTGREISRCHTTYQHPERPYQVYSPDALVVGERRGVDAKAPFWTQRRQYGLTEDDIPEYQQLQMWYYMSAIDYDQWDVAVYLGDGLPRIYTIERDREAERVMLAKAEEWWQRYIKGNERPPIGGSQDAREWLKQAFPTHKRPDIRTATDPEAELLDKYVELRIRHKRLKRELEKHENKLREAVGSREGIEWPGGKFTWRKTKDGEVVKWKDFAIGLRNQLIDEAEREKWTRFYTYPKPGYRRILLDSDALKDSVAREGDEENDEAADAA